MLPAMPRGSTSSFLVGHLFEAGFMDGLTFQESKVEVPFYSTLWSFECLLRYVGSRQRVVLMELLGKRLEK